MYGVKIYNVQNGRFYTTCMVIKVTPEFKIEFTNAIIIYNAFHLTHEVSADITESSKRLK